MVLTKEDLQKIKLPLSDEDYVTLREEELKTNGDVWKNVSKELKEAFEDKLIECFDKNSPHNQVSIEDMVWTPPATKEYKDYPVIRGYLTEEDLASLEEWHRNHPNS